jgi:hypothetical protein
MVKKVFLQTLMAREAASHGLSANAPSYFGAPVRSRQDFTWEHTPRSTPFGSPRRPPLPGSFRR